MRQNFYLLLFFSFFFLESHAQDYFIPLNHELNTRYDELLARKDVSFMPTARPYRADELRNCIPFDSLENDLAHHYYPNSEKATHTWAGRKLFSEHFIDINDTTDQFRMWIDPLFDFEGGRNQIIKSPTKLKSENLFTNTRGFTIQGSIGKNFIFYSTFYENQASFPYYVDSTIRQTGIVPGQGLVKAFGSTSYDYALPIGGISYTLNKHFNFTFANDKNFIGDGYRSLLLSDNSFTYPFLRITANIWKIRYTSISAVMEDAQARDAKDAGFRKKYATFHYFQLGVGKSNRLTLGLFDAVIWAYDTTGHRGYDIAYLNPVIFLKPLEESMDSPDNGVLGFTARYKAFNTLTLYGQYLIDDISIPDLRKNDGWWGNKQGIQVGFKSFNTFGVQHLSFQSELNYVKPYTYSHTNSGSNYAQYNQPLADPLGANFTESVNFLRYNYKRWYFEGELMIAVKGFDIGDLNYGGNVYDNYVINDSLTRVHEFGNSVGQGLKTTITHEIVKLAYLVNPATNMRIELGIDSRTYSNDYGKAASVYITFGLKASLINKYYDF